MGSSRLPGKVLAEVAGQPMLWHVVRRVRQARCLDEVVVATSSEPGDDAVAAFCQSIAVSHFRGSEGDVLDRYYQAARQYRAGAVVRITADCPLIDPQVIDRVVDEFVASGCDYAANIIHRTYPHGLDTEVCQFAALATAWRDAQLAFEREHVTPYLRDSGRFTLRNVARDVPLAPGYYRWTVDEARDLAFIRAVYRCLGTSDVFGWRTVVELVEAHAEIAALNAGVLHDAGFIGAARPTVVPPTGAENRSY